MSGSEGNNRLTDAEKLKRRRANLVIALSLFAFVVLVFIVTLTRLGGHVFDRHGMM